MFFVIVFKKYQHVITDVITFVITQPSLTFP